MAVDGKTFVDRGTLRVIDNQMDQTTGTIRMKAEFPNANLQLWPGQFINVRVLVDTLKQVVVVPTAAVQRGPQGTFVYVVDDDSKVAVRPITVAQQDDTQRGDLGRREGAGAGGDHRLHAALQRHARRRAGRARASRSRPRGAGAAAAGPARGPAQARGGAENTDGKERRRRSENAPAAPSAKQ